MLRMLLLLFTICLIVSASPAFAADETQKFDFSKTAWSAFNMTRDGEKYCVLGIKPIRASHGFDANEVRILYTPQIPIVVIVNELQAFRSDVGYLAGRYEAYGMSFSGKAGFLSLHDGGDRFDQVALESPRMRIVAGKTWVEFRITGFKNAFEKAARYCDVEYSLPLP